MAIRWAGEFLSVLLALSGPAMAWFRFPHLPEKIPIHFGFTGKAGGWGARPTIWLLPVLGIVLYGVITAVGYLDPLRVPAVLPIFKAAMLATFLIIQWEQIQVALGNRERLGPGVCVMLILVMVTAFFLR